TILMAYKDVEKRRAYHRKWHAEHRELRSKYIYKHRKKTRLVYNQRIIEYLKNHPCVDCGFSNILALEFDHLRDKVKDVMKMVRDLAPWNKIEEEIAKCEVRCANCHRIKTHRKSFRDLPL